MATHAVVEPAPPLAPAADVQPDAPVDGMALAVSLMNMMRDDLQRGHVTQRELVHVLRDLHDVTAGLRDELAHMRRERRS